jgi:hypothetical protein
VAWLKKKDKELGKFASLGIWFDSAEGAEWLLVNGLLVGQGSSIRKPRSVSSSSSMIFSIACWLAFCRSKSSVGVRQGTREICITWYLVRLGGGSRVATGQWPPRRPGLHLSFFLSHATSSIRKPRSVSSSSSMIFSIACWLAFCTKLVKPRFGVVVHRTPTEDFDLQNASQQAIEKIMELCSLRRVEPNTK